MHGIHSANSRFGHRQMDCPFQVTCVEGFIKAVAKNGILLASVGRIISEVKRLIGDLAHHRQDGAGGNSRRTGYLAYAAEGCPFVIAAVDQQNCGIGAIQGQLRDDDNDLMLPDRFINFGR